MQAETKVKPQTETEKLFAIDKPSLENLSYALRHPETWPEAFIWDYGNCDQCAMGLAHNLWSKIPAASTKTGSSIMAKAFAISHRVAESIFLGRTQGKLRAPWVPTHVFVTKYTGFWFWKRKTQTPDWRCVGPDMVADQIDEYLATVK